MTINQKPREHSYTYIFWKNIQWDFYKIFEVLRPLASWTPHFIKLEINQFLQCDFNQTIECCDHQWADHLTTPYISEYVRSQV